MKPLVRETLVWFVAAVTLAAVPAAEAQQPSSVPRIGYLSSTSLANLAGRIEAFRQGLRDLGYIEGKNIVIEWRDTKGNPDRLPDVAAELVRLKVDVIVSPGPTVTRVVRDATGVTASIPGGTEFRCFGVCTQSSN
jgi:putative tryptophan/tyrosine transport system substrate-binding protein